MDNIEETITKIPENLEHISKRFDFNFPNFKCRVCNNPDFGLLAINGQTRTMIPMKISDKINYAEFYTTTFACTSCGHIEEFLEKVLNKKLGVD